MKPIGTQMLMLLVILFSSSSVQSRTAANRLQFTKTTNSSPAYCLAGHNIGQMVLSISNNGTLGARYSSSGTSDCFTGEDLPSLEYPKGSGSSYLFGAALWVGAVVGSDTLVSTGQDGWSRTSSELIPDDIPLGNMIYRSTIDPTRPEYDGAISEQDYIAVYTDTCITCPGLSIDYLDGRIHLPINLEITQRSFGWSVPLAEDFVLFEYTLQNVGSSNISDIYLGMHVDGDVGDASNTIGFSDDIGGS